MTQTTLRTGISGHSHLQTFAPVHLILNLKNTNERFVNKCLQLAVTQRTNRPSIVQRMIPLNALRRSQLRICGDAFNG